MVVENDVDLNFIQKLNYSQTKLFMSLAVLYIVDESQTIFWNFQKKLSNSPIIG